MKLYPSYTAHLKKKYPKVIKYLKLERKILWRDVQSRQNSVGYLFSCTSLLSATTNPGKNAKH